MLSENCHFVSEMTLPVIYLPVWEGWSWEIIKGTLAKDSAHPSFLVCGKCFLREDAGVKRDILSRYHCTFLDNARKCVVEKHITEKL